MTLNLSWLEDFEALADCGNFSRAAERRHMTQPAFGRRIRALEDWLGAELFDRSGQPVTLTDAGRWLRGAAAALLAQTAALPGQARAVADGSAATLRFAATHALSLTFLPSWLRALEAQVALGPVELVSDVALRCEALLQARRVQFLLSHAHDGAPVGLVEAEHASVDVGRDRLLPLSVPDARGDPVHRLGPGPSRSAGAPAAPVPLLAYSPESGLGRVLSTLHGAALQRAGGQVVVTAHLASVLRSLALEGRGLAFLPECLVCDDLAAGRLVAAADEHWAVPLAIRLYRHRAPLPEKAERFWRACRAPVD